MSDQRCDCHQGVAIGRPQIGDSCAQCVVSWAQRSIPINKLWKIDHFCIQTKSVSHNKLVHHNGPTYY